LYTIAAYEGMGLGPKAFRKARLAEALGAKDLGDVVLPPLKQDRVEGGVKNLQYFKECTSLIYKKIRPLDTDRLVVVGGECSETVGALAGAAEAFGGKAGMVWMDAHGDFNTPATSPSGYIGGMCLAMACGRSPELRIKLGGNAPPIAEDRLVHIGSRALDEPEVEAFNSSPVTLFTAGQVRKSGAQATAKMAAKKLQETSDWIACHLDLDVIDPASFSPVNYPAPGGLSIEDVALIINHVAATGRLRVVEIVAYNASKDTGGSEAKKIVDVIGRALD
jgi:arginase